MSEGLRYTKRSDESVQKINARPFEKALYLIRSPLPIVSWALSVEQLRTLIKVLRGRIWTEPLRLIAKSGGVPKYVGRTVPYGLMKLNSTLSKTRLYSLAVRQQPSLCTF